MAFAKPDHFVWDFWLADDGERYHLFYLHAPHSVGHPDLRHRNARIGHASSHDLRTWSDHGLAFPAGDSGAFDDTATWTGSVTRGPDGLWRLFYTGSHFLAQDANPNIETIGVAVSSDLFGWTKVPGPIVRADARWYETYGSSSWPEEAWRDPWVFEGTDGLWHMLITARANHGEIMERGVIGHATSTDLVHWAVAPPLSAIGTGFAHLEVPQIVTIDERAYLIFSCDTPRLAGRLEGETGGVWYAIADSAEGPYDPLRAQLLATQDLYAGRLVKDRQGRWALMAFDMRIVDGVFRGGICDPIPVVADAANGALSLERGIAQ